MPQLSRTRARRIGFAGLMLATAMVTGGPSVAARDPRIIHTGACTANSDWKLKVKSEDGGRLEVEFEVDSNVNGQPWHITLRDNDVVVARADRTTVAPSGSFEFRKLIANRAGTDHVKATAKNQTTGEVCKGTVNF